MEKWWCPKGKFHSYYDRKEEGNDKFHSGQYFLSLYYNFKPTMDSRHGSSVVYTTHEG